MFIPGVSRLRCGLVLLLAATAVSACAPPENEGEEPLQKESSEDSQATLGAAKASFELPNSLLPFDMPARADLATSPYKVFAHWHNFPLRTYSSNGGVYTDNYTTWLKPAGNYV